MIFNLDFASGHEFERPDVCIVGAGAAGIVLAVELQRQGKRVLLLEAGGADIEESSQEPYQSQLVSLPHRGIHSGRVRAYGGTTNKWGGQILELDEIDFSSRAWVQGCGWPFPKSRLADDYKRALVLEGVAGAATGDADVWSAIGMESPQLGAELVPFLSRWCPEPNFARLHGALLEQSQDIGIYLHANACGILTDETRGRITGILCRTYSGKAVTFAAPDYVLCMGAIEVSRFLLQAGEEGICPWNHSRLVGRHFQDHLACNCAVITPSNDRLFHAMFDNIFFQGYKYHPKFKLATSLQAKFESLNVGGGIVFQSDLDEVLGQLKITARRLLQRRFGDIEIPHLLFLARHLPTLARQLYRYKFDHRIYNPKSAQIMLRVFCEQEPMGQSRISLSESRDSLGMKRAKLDWKISDLEIRTIRCFVEAVSREFERSHFARLEIDQDLYSNEAAFVEKISDDNHHMGGTRMSISPKNGVVDTDLRLHGIENCYVCSSSVFPSSGFSNPTHTLLALAMRLATHLATGADPVHTSECLA